MSTYPLLFRKRLTVTFKSFCATKEMNENIETANNSDIFTGCEVLKTITEKNP